MFKHMHLNKLVEAINTKYYNMSIKDILNHTPEGRHWRLSKRINEAAVRGDKYYRGVRIRYDPLVSFTK